MSAEPVGSGGHHRSRWWVAVITFVVGVAVGILVVGLLRLGTPEFPTVSGPTPGLTSTTSPLPSAPDTIGASAEAQVNAACLRVIKEAQEVYEIISGVDEATADVDLQRLDDLVRQLQPIEPRLQRDLQDCNVDTSAGGNPGGGSTSPAPTDPQGTPTR